MASRKRAKARPKKGAAKRPAGRTRAAATRARKASGGRAAAKGLVSLAPSFTVGDLDKSMAWYRDVLGAVVTDRWEHDGTLMGVEMRAGAVTFMLGQDDWKKGRDRVKGQGFRLYCETTEDIDRLAERIRAAGVTLAQEPRDESWGARTLAVDDPDGFKVTVSKMKTP